MKKFIMNRLRESLRVPDEVELVGNENDYKNINFNDIEIKNNNLGKPFIEIINDKNVFLQNHFNCKKFNIHLTITDQNSISGAVVIIEKITD